MAIASGNHYRRMSVHTFTDRMKELTHSDMQRDNDDGGADVDAASLFRSRKQRTSSVAAAE